MFTRTRHLAGAPRGQKLGFFSGSTIGNLTHEEARDFLVNAAHLLGRNSAFLIGVDLNKVSIVPPADDDDDGVTASFSLNMLARINRDKLDGIYIGSFAHRAVYNDAKGRIEYLKSLTEQTVQTLERCSPSTRANAFTELAQIFGARVPGAGVKLRLAPGRGLDRLLASSRNSCSTCA